MKLSIKSQGQSLTLVKGQSDFKVKCLTFGLYTQVSNSGPHGPLVLLSISSFFFFLSLGDGLIQTEILSQRAVKPKITNQST